MTAATLLLVPWTLLAALALAAWRAWGPCDCLHAMRETRGERRGWWCPRCNRWRADVRQPDGPARVTLTQPGKPPLQPWRDGNVLEIRR